MKKLQFRRVDGVVEMTRKLLPLTRMVEAEPLGHLLIRDELKLGQRKFGMISGNAQDAERR
jgi:hypothetical protein